MTKPRRPDPDHGADADRLLAETQAQRDHITLIKAHPRRQVRNPCGEPDTCQHGCYGTVDEAAHVRKTGLPPQQ